MSFLMLICRLNARFSVSFSIYLPFQVQYIQKGESRLTQKCFTLYFFQFFLAFNVGINLNLVYGYNFCMENYSCLVLFKKCLVVTKLFKINANTYH